MPASSSRVDDQGEVAVGRADQRRPAARRRWRWRPGPRPVSVPVGRAVRSGGSVGVTVAPVARVAVGRHVLGSPGREQRDVGADDGVDRILDAAQLALAFGRLDRLAQFEPVVVVGDPQRRGGLGQSLDEVHQPQQLRPQLREAAARLGLVLQGPAEPEQRHRRRVRVDLDGPSWRLRLADRCRGRAPWRAGRRAACPRTRAFRCSWGVRPASNFAKSRLSAASLGRWPVGLVTTSGASKATRQSPST